MSPLDVWAGPVLGLVFGGWAAIAWRRQVVRERRGRGSDGR